MAKILDFNDALPQRDDRPTRQDNTRVERLKDALQTQAKSFVAWLFPAATFARGQAYIGSIHGEAGDSLVIETEGRKCGLWKDFASGDGGNDFISLFQAVHKVSFPKALEDLEGWTGQGPKPQAFAAYKAPQAAQEQQLGAPTGTWHYRDATGSIVATVYRYDHLDKRGKPTKTYRPWNALTRKAEFPENRILYNLPGVLAADTIVFVEGEKAAQALIADSIPATAVMGGAKTVLDKCDLSPLHGRHVIIWPDNDMPGLEFAGALANRLSLIGVASVRVISIPPGKPEGWDAADASPDERREILGGAKEEAASTITATPYQWTDPATIPAREWLYGRHLIRKFVSTTIAPGGIGKSSLVIGEALAMVTGKNLYGHNIGEDKLRVWLWNLEDPRDELTRRIQAICLNFGISANELGGRFFVDSGREQRCVIAEQAREGVEFVRPVIDKIVAELQQKRIDVLIIDPFVSCHTVSENDNMAIDAVAKEWGRVADRANCAIELVHHTRKLSGESVTAESSRGAIALVSASRDTRVINRMTEEEGIKANVENYRLYFRAYSDKQNLAPPSDKSDWYYLKSIDLGQGDHVGVVTPWTWPDPFEDLKTHHLIAVQKAFGTDRYREDMRARDWAGYIVADVLGLNPTDPVDKNRIKSILKIWTENGCFKRVTDLDDKRMPRTFLEVAQWVEK